MVIFTKTKDAIIVWQGKTCYTICRHISPDINLDTWRIYSGDINGVTVFRGTDIEGPIKQVGTTDFISGCHGDERYKSVTILVDGIQIEENDVVAHRKAENVTVYVESVVFFCDNANSVAFERYKKLEFIEKKLIISNKWKYVGGRAFHVDCFTGCGLYSVYKDLLSGYSTDQDCRLINDRGTKQNKHIEEVQFYGKGFVITLRLLSGKGEHYAGSVADFASEERPRFKAYLLCVSSALNNFIMNSNDELNVSFEIEICCNKLY